MNWEQKKCIRISECRVVYDFFQIGTNWNNRKKKLSSIDSPKAKILCNRLDVRIDKIVEALHSASIVFYPDWYFNRLFDPIFSDLHYKK